MTELDLPVQETVIRQQTGFYVLVRGAKRVATVLPLPVLLLEARAAEPQRRKMSSRAGGWSLAATSTLTSPYLSRLFAQPTTWRVIADCHGSNAESPAILEASICTCMPTGQFFRFRTQQDRASQQLSVFLRSGRRPERGCNCRSGLGFQNCLFWLSAIYRLQNVCAKNQSRPRRVVAGREGGRGGRA